MGGGWGWGGAHQYWSIRGNNVQARSHTLRAWFTNFPRISISAYLIQSVLELCPASRARSNTERARA